MPVRTRQRSHRAAALAMTLTVAIAAGGCTESDDATRSDAVRAQPTQSTTAAKPAPRPTLAPPLKRGEYRGPVPILMYHVMAAPPAGAAYSGLWTSPAAFKAQTRALADAGYTAVTLDQVDGAWHGGPGLPNKPVVFTFDDGYLSQLTNAAPVLRQLGWRGVLNLEVRNIRAGDLTERQVRSLLARGWELAAHTRTHPDLTTLGAAALDSEVGGSRCDLQKRFGEPVAFFAYPAGSFNASAQQAVRDAGFRGATTTEPGIARPGDDRTALPRLRIDGNTSPAALLTMVEGG